MRAAIVSTAQTRMYKTTDHLLRYHYNSLGGEPSIAVIKEVLQRWSEEINDQDVVKAFLAEIIDIRDPSYCASVSRLPNNPLYALTAANKNFVCPVLVSQLWGVALSRFLKGSKV